MSFLTESLHQLNYIKIKKNIIFGRDNLSKGSWLGCNNFGKIAFILNLRTKLNSDLKKGVKRFNNNQIFKY